MKYQEYYDHLIETAHPEVKGVTNPIFIDMFDYGEGVVCRGLPSICFVDLDKYIECVKKVAEKSEVEGKLVAVKCIAFYDLSGNKFVNLTEPFEIMINEDTEE